MFKMKEISADQVLTLLFMSLGKGAAISFNDIDKFFDELKKVCDKTKETTNYGFGINMPMNGNFDETLFSEIREGEDNGKLVFLNSSSSTISKIQNEKLTRHFIYLVKDNTVFRKNCLLAMKSFKEKKDKEKLEIPKTNNKTLIKRLKEIVKH